MAGADRSSSTAASNPAEGDRTGAEEEDVQPRTEPAQDAKVMTIELIIVPMLIRFVKGVKGKVIWPIPVSL